MVQVFQQISSTKPWKLFRNSDFVGHTISQTGVAKQSQEKAAPRESICAQSRGVPNPIRFKTIVEAAKVSALKDNRSAIFALEIFAGTARLTACLRSLGSVDSDGIDCAAPTRLNCPIIKLDLLQPSHLKLVKDLITNRACVYVQFAPPCGTASRARLIQDGEKYMPPPLRNDQRPNGLPWLTKDQQERVNKANELYRITCELITLCQTHQLLWSCENPGRSFMWQTTSFQRLFSTVECQSTQMHH